jgi:hypothetical protein
LQQRSRERERERATEFGPAVAPFNPHAYAMHATASCEARDVRGTVDSIITEWLAPARDRVVSLLHTGVDRLILY